MRKSIQKPFEGDELIKELQKEFERFGTTSITIYDNERKEHLPSSHRVRTQLNNVTWEEVVIMCGYKPNRVNWTKEKILELATSKNRQLNYAELKALGLHSDVIKNHFKTHKNFHEVLGWDYEEKVFYREVSNEELLEEYEEVCKIVGKVATIKEINELSKFPYELYRSRFGTINEVRKLTGYTHYKDPRTISKNECMREMLLIYEKHGRINYNQLEKVLPFHTRTLLRRFGTTSIKDVWKEVISEYEKRN